MLRVAHGEPLQLTGAVGELGERLDDVDVALVGDADCTPRFVLRLALVEFRAFQAVAVQLHDVDHGNFLVRLKEQGIERLVAVFSRRGRREQLVTPPGAQVRKRAAFARIDRHGQVIASLSVDDGIPQFLQAGFQTRGEDITVGLVQVHPADHDLVAEHRHLVLRQTHSRVGVAAVVLEDPGLVAVGEQQGVILFGTVLVQQLCVDMHRLFRGSRLAADQRGQDGFAQAVAFVLQRVQPAVFRGNARGDGTHHRQAAFVRAAGVVEPVV